MEFAKEGAKVSLTGRNVANLEKTAKKCREAGLGEDDVISMMLCIYVKVKVKIKLFVVFLRIT